MIFFSSNKLVSLSFHEYLKNQNHFQWSLKVPLRTLYEKFNLISKLFEEKFPVSTKISKLSSLSVNVYFNFLSVFLQTVDEYQNHDLKDPGNHPSAVLFHERNQV